MNEKTVSRWIQAVGEKYAKGLYKVSRLTEMRVTYLRSLPYEEAHEAARRIERESHDDRTEG